jgi:hypothetical protein
MDHHSRNLLIAETRAMLTRLALVKPFVLQETMLPAAALLLPSQIAIEKYLVKGRRELGQLLRQFLQWLNGPTSTSAPTAQAHTRFTILRLKFNIVLTQFDMFADVITQRSESETGVWLSGLDVAAGDALALPGYYAAPPVICYLDRDIGAAIRRARTRLPGGGENPVAVVRVPRERMVGSGVASSLVHEVGHQAAALLGLVDSLQQVLQGLQRTPGPDKVAWRLWERWISEIVADFWSVARIGVGSTIGLMSVVSLPRPFVFRINADDPHPSPWVRVKLSAAIGDALYPHPQWQRLSAVWDAFYPMDGLPAETLALFERLNATIPALVSLLINHRPRSLRGSSLQDVMRIEERRPAQLSDMFQKWLVEPSRMYRTRPSLALAVLGQARMDERLSPETESALLTKLLTFWALRATLDMSEMCVAAPQAQGLAA